MPPAGAPLAGRLPGRLVSPPAPTSKPAAVYTVNGRRIDKIVGDPRSSTLYGFAENGWLLRTTNNGRSWSLVTTSPTVREFIISAGNPRILYGSTAGDCDAPSTPGGALLRSENGGQKWIPLPGAVNLRPLLTSPADPATVLATDCTSFYLSRDGGQTWSASLAAPGDPLPATLLLQAAMIGDDLLWPAGVTERWALPVLEVDSVLNRAGLPPDLQIDGLNSLAYGEDGVLYLATDQGLLSRKVDEPAWRFVPDQGLRRRNTQNVLLTASHPHQLWVNTEAGVYRLFLAD